jgi:folate-binding protein YgfZ
MIGPRVGTLAPAGAPLDVMGGVLFDLQLVEVSADATERWRVDAGIPRMGADFDTTSFPAEAGLDDAIAYDKGCFLGQESVARIRNLGHPPTVLRHVRSDAPLRAGDQLASNGDRVGSVTSAAPRAEGSVALAKVSWEARTADLTSGGGHPVHDVPRSG